MPNTYIEFGQLRKKLSERLGVFFFRLVRQVGDLWEGLIHEVVGEEWRDVFGIASAIGFDQPVNDLELWSGSIDEGHLGCGFFSRGQWLMWDGWESSCNRFLYNNPSPSPLQSTVKAQKTPRNVLTRFELTKRLSLHKVATIS